MLDGVNNQGAFVSTYAVPPIVDSVQEFKVQSHNDQAEFGRALGGIINVVLKSGTKYCTAAFGNILRNDVFDARNTFSKTSKTPFRQNQYGAAGEVRRVPKLYNGRNKTFFLLGGKAWQAIGGPQRRVPSANGS